MKAQDFSPFRTDPKRVKPETIDQIASVVGAMRDIPEGFPSAFREWAADWGRLAPDEKHGCHVPWAVEIRPYTVAELARLPGMPGRTKLHEIIKSMDLRKEQIRNEGGKLTPQAVRKIIDRLSAGRCELKEQPPPNPQPR